jgi:hypothetical protein
MAQARNTDPRPRPLRALMDVLVVLAVLLLVRVIVAYFGALAATRAGSWYLATTRALAPPVLGAWSMTSPYGGVFTVGAGIVIVVLLTAEWILAAASSRRAERRSGEDPRP